MLTKKEKVVRSYWPYMLGLCEEVFLDLGNLKAKPGTKVYPVLEGRSPNPGATEYPDPEQCKRFRDKWFHGYPKGLGEFSSGVFQEWLETEDDALLGLRNMVRNAIIHDDPNELRTLTVRLANLPPLGRRSKAHIDLPWSDRTSGPSSLFPRAGLHGFTVPLATLGFGVKRWRAPILFDLPRALAAAILSFTGKGLKLVCCPECGQCAIGRSNQRFCPGGACRRAWHQHQPANKEKRREYMREKMREYRALEKLLDRTNTNSSRGTHGKAT